MPQSGLREVVPDRCPVCESATWGGWPFCRSCRSFLPAPDAGLLASGRRRLGAFALDSVLKEGGLLGPALWPTIMPDSAGRVVVSIMGTIYGIATLYLWTKGTTPAKRLLGMTVITEDGEPAGFWRMALRETIGKWISFAAVGLGFVAIATSADNRGWHDRMAGTWVVVDDEA